MSTEQKNICAFVTKIYKSLVDINFMKPYFIIKKCLIVYKMNVPQNYHQQIPGTVELTQFFSENIYCGIGCHSP